MKRNFAADLFDERPDDDAGLRIRVRVFGLETIGDARQVGFGLRSADPWLESRGDEETPFVARGPCSVERLHDEHLGVRKDSPAESRAAAHRRSCGRCRRAARSFRGLRRRTRTPPANTDG